MKVTIPRFPVEEEKLDFYVQPNKEHRYAKATVGTLNGKKVMAFVLVECEVLDLDRFTYFNGQWYKLMEVEQEVPEGEG